MTGRSGTVVCGWSRVPPLFGRRSTSRQGVRVVCPTLGSTPHRGWVDCASGPLQSGPSRSSVVVGLGDVSRLTQRRCRLGRPPGHVPRLAPVVTSGPP